MSRSLDASLVEPTAFKFAASVVAVIAVCFLGMIALAQRRAIQPLRLVELSTIWPGEWTGRPTTEGVLTTIYEGQDMIERVAQHRTLVKVEMDGRP